jgi:hypothetical protein
MFARAQHCRPVLTLSVLSLTVSFSIPSTPVALTFHCLPVALPAAPLANYSLHSWDMTNCIFLMIYLTTLFGAGWWADR